MNAKVIIAGIASAVATFLLGWLVYGTLLSDYFKSSMTSSYPGLMKDPPLIWAIGVANLAWGFALAYILSIAGIRNVAKGFVTGFLIMGLILGGVDAMSYAQMNLTGAKVYAVDVAIGAVFGGISGTVIALIYSRKQNS